MNANKRKSTPQLLIEKLHLGELAPSEAVAVRARLERDGELQRLTALASDSTSGPMPPDLALRIANQRARERATRKVHARSWTLLVTAASFAIMALVIATPPADTNRTKGGGAALIIYRKAPAGDGYEALADNATVRRDDVLQLALRAGDARQAAVYSIDGRGIITEHQPPRPVSGPAELRLAEGYQLDDAPRFERFLLVLGDALDGPRIRRAVAMIAANEPATDPLVIDGARVISRLLLKEPP